MSDSDSAGPAEAPQGTSKAAEDATNGPEAALPDGEFIHDDEADLNRALKSGSGDSVQDDFFTGEGDQ